MYLVSIYVFSIYKYLVSNDCCLCVTMAVKVLNNVLRAAYKLSLKKLNVKTSKTIL